MFNSFSVGAFAGYCGIKNGAARQGQKDAGIIGVLNNIVTYLCFYFNLKCSFHTFSVA